MYRCTLLIAGVLASTATANTFSGQCPDVKGVDSFDPKQIVGDWYLISTDDNVQTHGDRCTMLHIGLNRNGDVYTNNMTMTSIDAQNKLTTYRTILQYNKPGSSTALGVVQKEGTSQWSHVYPFMFAAIDYNSYLLQVGCWNEFDSTTLRFKLRMIGRIWSRYPTLFEETVNQMSNQLQSYHLDVSEHQIQDHSNC